MAQGEIVLFENKSTKVASVNRRKNPFSNVLHNLSPPQTFSSQNNFKKYISPATNRLVKLGRRGRKVFVKQFSTGEDEKKLGGLLEQSNDLIFKTSTVFPFVFFPDDLLIDFTKVTAIKRRFFASEEASSILIENIADVIVDSAPFFASIIINDQFYVQNSIEVHYLKKKDAYRVRHIIMGLMIAYERGIDFSKIDRNTLASSLEELGNPMHAII